MKKMFAIAILAFASSFALAGDRVALEEYKPAADVSTTASDKSAPTALEDGAAKVGSFIGGMLKGPAMLGKAFAGGIGAGFKGTVAPAPAPSHTANTNSTTKLSEWQENTPTTATPATASSKNPLADALAGLIRRAKDQKLAPVEDRSVPASAFERQPLASNLY